MKIFDFYIDGEKYAVDAAFIQRVEANVRITPVPAAAEGIIGVTAVKGKVATMLKIVGKQAADAGYALIFKPDDIGDRFGTLIDKPGEFTETDDKPDYFVDLYAAVGDYLWKEGEHEKS